MRIDPPTELLKEKEKALQDLAAARAYQTQMLERGRLGWANSR